MQSYKTIYFITIFLITVLAFLPTSNAVSCQGKSHNVTYGARRPGDKLVFQDHIKQSWKLLRYIKKEITYPLKGDKKKEKITHIELRDRYTNGHGGCPYIEDGGIGKKHVKIIIKSEFNRGIDFDVKIYAK